MEIRSISPRGQVGQGVLMRSARTTRPLPLPFKQVDFLKASGVTDRPLSPNEHGGTVDNRDMVSTIEEVAKLCGEAVSNRNGARRFGHHTFRLIGAQTLAASGIQVDKIRI